MAKPLNENLKAVYVETEEGDMLPVMDLAGNKFAELTNYSRYGNPHIGWRLP